jgi:molecular chaperone DnaK
MKVGSFFGIDFGTTFTEVSRIVTSMDDGSTAVIKTERLGKAIPSFIAFSSEDMPSFGDVVKKSLAQRLDAREVVISSFKSLLGTNKKRRINNKEYSPVQIVGKYLECVKREIESAHKHTFEIIEAAFSVPTDFTAEARRDLRKAAQLAGITVTDFVSESTAAYLSERDNLKGLPRVMVIDWGGGTLDVSILETEGGKVREIAVYGEKIGGDDIDAEIAERVHSLINLKITDASNRVQFKEMPPEQRDKMISECEAAKINLSNDGEKYPLTIENYGTYETKTITLSYEMFEDMVTPIIRNRVLPAIDKAMERARLSKAGIDAVIMAGGSSNLRPFANAMLNLFGKEKMFPPEDAQYVSAAGAAITQIVGGDFKLSDGIGIVMSDNTVFPILNKDTAGVGSRSQTYTFSLVEDSQNAHFIISNTDAHRRIDYDKVNIPTKGFLRERLEVSASIDEDRIATVKIHSTAVPDALKDTVVNISNLTFHYDLSEIDG